MSKVKKSTKQMLNSSSDQSGKEEITSQPVSHKSPVKSTNNLINPEILTYITRVQGERDKTTKKITVAESQEKKYDLNQYNGLNDNMNVDKTQKACAKKGLLYLLNNLSGGTFCPEINVYFEEMKDMKKNEIMNNPFKGGDAITKEIATVVMNNNNTPEANASLTPTSTLLRKDLIEKETPYVHYFRRRKEGNDKEEKEEEGFGIKAFREDIDSGNKKDNNPNVNPVVVFNFNKEKQAKLKIMSKDKKEKKKTKVSNYFTSDKADLMENNTLRRLPFRNSTQNCNLLLKNKISEGDGSSLR